MIKAPCIYVCSNHRGHWPFPQGTLTSDRPAASPTSSSLHPNRRIATTRLCRPSQEKHRSHLSPALMLQGRGRAQQEEARACQMGFPKLKVRWQGAFRLKSVPRPWGCYSQGWKDQLKRLTSSLWRAGRLLSTTICYSFCTAHSRSHGNLFPLWLPDRPFKIAE